MRFLRDKGQAELCKENIDEKETLHSYRIEGVGSF